MGQSKITRILLHKTNTNLENVSEEASNAFVMNIKTFHGKLVIYAGHQKAPYSDIDAVVLIHGLNIVFFFLCDLSFQTIHFV